jgi:Ankyrin repeats (3 copies)
MACKCDFLFTYHDHELTDLSRFLFAKLHMDSIISKPTRRHIEGVLNNLTTAHETFQPFYEQSMNRIMDQIPESKSLAIRTLSWIAYSRDSLTLSELQHALAVEDAKPGFDEHGIPEIESIISVCYGLVAFDEFRNTVSFSHQTVRACLKQNQRIWLPDAERDIATTCVTYLSYNAFENGPCSSHRDFTLRLHSYPLLTYAAHNWGHHAVACKLEEENLILNFLSNRSKLAAAFQVILASKSEFDGSEIISKQVTGLHVAAYFGLKRTIVFLIEHGHPPAPTDFYGQTPLWWAAKERHIDAMTVLGRLDTVTLQMLIQHGDLNLVKLLLVAGHDVNTKGFWNRSPLHEAILSRNITLTRELISAGADTNSKDSDDFTPLQLAVRRADRKFIELLLKNLANENGIMSNEWRRAFKKGSSDFVQLSENKDLGKFLTFSRDENISWSEHEHNDERPLEPRSLRLESCTYFSTSCKNLGLTN